MVNTFIFRRASRPEFERGFHVNFESARYYLGSTVKLMVGIVVLRSRLSSSVRKVIAKSITV